MTKRPKMAWKKALLRLADLWPAPYLEGSTTTSSHSTGHSITKKLCREANHPVAYPEALRQSHPLDKVCLIASDSSSVIRSPNDYCVSHYRLRDIPPRWPLFCDGPHISHGIPKVLHSFSRPRDRYIRITQDRSYGH